jgi:dTDP-L-rhamnose 4-epimerase
MRILVTGGAGFIGSHLCDELLERGHHVRVLDSLIPQVHGDEPIDRPEYLHAAVELVRGDVRDADAVRHALDGIEAVFHFAARVGVGQSMYQTAEYTSVNNLGTAVLLEELIAQPIQRLVVASSMSIYGEGLYRAPDGRLIEDAVRSREQLRRGEWDPRVNGAAIEPVPTSESKPPRLASIYALSKYDQERLCLLIGAAYSIPTVALRFFNVYGTRQALSNPYTGVLAIFASRLLSGGAPVVFEDGQQMRDFVSVHDIVQGCRLALEQPAESVAGLAINIGSGQPVRVLEIAEMLANTLGVDREPVINGRARIGDVRHCFADISLARTALGYEPGVRLADGLVELTEWLITQEPEDNLLHASLELEQRGLTV